MHIPSYELPSPGSGFFFKLYVQQNYTKEHICTKLHLGAATSFILASDSLCY